MKPYIRINFASSLDGRISSLEGKSFKFSNLEDMERVHRLRAISDIILVGKNTVNGDDPKLVVNSKYYESSHIPDVAILDSHIEVNKSARVFSYPRKVIVICGQGADEKKLSYNFKSEVIIKKCHTKVPTAKCAVNHLEGLGYDSIMVEGGKSVITSFLNEGLWDEISIFFSTYIMGEKGTPMVGTVNRILKLDSPNVTKLGDGFLVDIKKEF